MPHELINLLPPERKRAFRRDYFYRLGTVALLLLSALVIIHGIMLLPTYLYLQAVEKTRAAELANLNEQLADAEQDGTSARLAALKADATHLSRLADTGTASAAVRMVLDVPRSGIAIQNISFTPPSATTAADGKMAISGTAATREALRAYSLALSSVPFISKVDLPISAYAKDIDIDFTVTLTGTLKP
jgi:hypothetical protein